MIIFMNSWEHNHKDINSILQEVEDKNLRDRFPEGFCRGNNGSFHNSRTVLFIPTHRTGKKMIRWNKLNYSFLYQCFQDDIENWKLSKEY